MSDQKSPEVSVISSERLARLLAQASPDDSIRPPTEAVAASLERARQIMGTDFIGEGDVRALQDALNKSHPERTVDFLIDPIPEFPFTEAELEWAKSQDMFVVLRTGQWGMGVSTGTGALALNRSNFWLFRSLYNSNLAFSDMAAKSSPWYVNDNRIRNSGMRSEWALSASNCLEGTQRSSRTTQETILAEYNDQIRSSVSQNLEARRRSTMEAVWDTMLFKAGLGLPGAQRNLQQLWEVYDTTEEGSASGTSVLVGGRTSPEPGIKIRLQGPPSPGSTTTQGPNYGLIPTVIRRRV